MSISDTVTRSAASSEAGRRERLPSPAVVQAGRAVRHATGEQRWAKTTESATATDHITCNLLDSDGESIEEVEVYCTIAGPSGAVLNDSSPRLPADLTIPVTYYLGQWRCLWSFEGDEDCVCTSP